jgi:hypothetical protein
MLETTTVSDEAILRGLNANPQIKNRIASLLAAVEDAAGDLKQADAAEMRMIEEIRRMGQEAMQAWATRQVEKAEQELRQRGGVKREGKKTVLAHHLWRHPRSGAAVPVGQQKAAPFCAKRQSPASRLLAPAPARGHRLWG